MLNKQIIINDIKKLSLSDYKKTIIEFVEEFKHPEITLYMFGNIKHPSISDLDLIIVYDDHLKDDFIEKIVKKARNFVNSDDIKKYIFTHDILIYPKSLFKKIKFLHTFQNMKILSGKEIDISIPSKKQQDLINKVHFINFTYNTLFWIKNIEQQKKVYLRYLLSTLYSVKHSFVFLNSIYQNLELIKWIEILEKVRENFNDIKKISLKELGMVIFKYLNKFLTKFLKEWIYFPNFSEYISKKVLILHGKKLFLVPALILLHGASYWKCCPEYEKFIYWQIHRYLYPVNNFVIKNDDYKTVLKYQMDTAIKFENLYKKYYIKPMIPLMCNYCVPTITKKQRVSLLINNFIIKMQL